MRVAVVGGSGYTGVELLRILSRHPQCRVTAVTSRKYKGTGVQEVFPSLRGLGDISFIEPDIKAISSLADFAITAVPHQAAMDIVPDFLKNGLKVVDLSADFRIKSKETYEAWYQRHSAPDLLEEAVYGLSEIYGQDIAEARLVANPGCYPTSTLLPMIPILRERLVRPENIIVDSKSGASGAGRSANLVTIFCEVNEAFKAYKVGNHRHTPEIEQELSGASGLDVKINFTPHLVPMTRGILTTIYGDLMDGVDENKVREAWMDFYKNADFVRVLSRGKLPNVSHVRGSNYCDMGFHIDKRTNKIIIVSAIDNLVKGAAGQAVQNLNVMSGMEETLGLESVPLFP
jgi:N-acetyl-gamma-glutamyl-phosphate reductase